MKNKEKDNIDNNIDNNNNKNKKQKNTTRIEPKKKKLERIWREGCLYGGLPQVHATMSYCPS